MRPLAGVGIVLLVLAGVIWLSRRTHAAVLERMRRSGRRAIPQFRGRLDRYKLVERDIIREQLLHDPEILAAIERHAQEYEEAESQVRMRVNQYIDEIVPFFNVLSYYRIGFCVLIT